MAVFQRSALHPPVPAIVRPMAMGNSSSAQALASVTIGIGVVLEEFSGLGACDDLPGLALQVEGQGVGMLARVL